MAVKYLQSLCERAVQQVRYDVGSPANDADMSADNILQRLATAYTNVLVDQATLTQRPVVLTMDYTLQNASGDQRFLLPASCSAVRHVTIVNTANDVAGHFVRLPRYNALSLFSGYKLQGEYLVLIKPADITASTTVRLYFEPYGYAPLHYGLLDATVSANVDQTNGLWVVPLNGTSQVGEIDTRPNASVGSWFHIYETSTSPTGYSGGSNIRNQDQQMITSYAMTTKRMTLQNALAFPTLVGKGGTWKYEIVPSLNWQVWNCACKWLAREICGPLGRDTRARALNSELTMAMRTLRITESDFDLEGPPEGEIRLPLITAY